MKLLRWVTNLFLFLWIFYIPASLAFHWNLQAGLVNGYLVDYRIPQINASALLLVMFLLSLLLVRKQVRLFDLGKVAVVALLATMIFQISLGLFQFKWQVSLMGYLPLGEVAYTSTQIAKGVFGGAILKLPYGTTAHPNVLAGFLVIFFFILLLLQTFIPLSKKLLGSLLLFVILMCVLTQSLTALGGLILGGLLFLFKSKLILLTRLAILLLPLFFLILFSLPQIVVSPNPSLSRRASLQTVAINMVKRHPLKGVGWNNFTLLQESYGFIPGTVRFLQPVHNSFLLLVTELGIAGWLVLILLGIMIWKIHPRHLPLIAILVFIASLDHYLLTLTTGRMLILLVLFLYLLHGKSEGSERVIM